jgi:hypothetical protein
MDRAAIKKYNATRRSRIRPRGCPVEFLFLKSQQVLKENHQLLDIQNKATVLGSYSTKKKNGSWLSLVKEGDEGYVWIFQYAIKEKLPWSEEIQARFDNKEFEEVPIPQKDLSLSVKQMLVLLQINGEEQQLMIDLKGRLKTPQEGFNTMKDYLAHLTQKHGTRAVNYQYQLQ